MYFLHSGLEEFNDLQHFHDVFFFLIVQNYFLRNILQKIINIFSSNQVQKLNNANKKFTFNSNCLLTI